TRGEHVGLESTAIYQEGGRRSRERGSGWRCQDENPICIQFQCPVPDHATGREVGVVGLDRRRVGARDRRVRNRYGWRRGPRRWPVSPEVAEKLRPNEGDERERDDEGSRSRCVDQSLASL